MTEVSLNSEDLILRDRLALERTRLANERTLLAYIRTAFMLIVPGATALKVFVDTPAVVVTAWLFIGLGVFVGGFGGWRFVTVRRGIEGVSWGRGPAFMPGRLPDARGIVVNDPQNQNGCV